MPRKTDGIEFEIHPRPTKGEDGKPLLYVRPAKGRKKSFKQLEDFCNKYRNLRTGELQMVMNVMMDVVGLWLSDGYLIRIIIDVCLGHSAINVIGIHLQSIGYATHTEVNTWDWHLSCDTSDG